MAHDMMSQFYTSLQSLPLQEKLLHLTRIIEQSSPNKDLQALFPELISNIFSTSFNNGWGLRTVTCDGNRYDYDALISFFEPMGPMFQLCYKLLSDPQLKYNLPLNVLPLDLQMTLERGRCPQFYADMVTTDSQSLHVVALALNPFDYYIFNFALHLVNNSQNKSTWENWNSVYFALACDYLMHFLPSDPNAIVLPPMPNYTGKVPMVAPLQTANRPLYSPSLLLLPDLSGNSMSNQHTHTTQNQSRNEVWRSETVLQVFIDIWMSVEPFNARNLEIYQRNYQVVCSSPERVRTVRVLVKHLHSFSSKHFSDPAVRSSTLRKYARQMMCVRAYHYIKHLVTIWPLDASFRLVMELWLSFIQPWRYVNNTISQDRFPVSNNNQEDGNTNTLDASFTQFIAENFPSYTCMFQLILPRFMRLDLTAYKNAIMLFRLGKVFSQQHLVPILRNLEQGITDSSTALNGSPDISYNNSGLEQSYTYNGVPLHKWVTIAKQSTSELNLSANYEYEPIWVDNRYFATELVKKIISAKLASETYVQELTKKIYLRNQGIWSSILHFLMIGNQDEDEILLEECKKVPTYLNASIHHFSTIFLLNESTLLPSEANVDDNSLEHSSYVNSTSFPLTITNKLRRKPTAVQYMGDPDLMPITSYESTILVRMLYQIATRLNEIYGSQITQLWHRNDLWGYMAREVLQQPCSVQTYVRDVTNHQNIARQDLPPRLSLRRLGSHAFVVWITIGYFFFKLLSFSGFFYVFIIALVWLLFIFTKASSKMLRVI